MHLLVLGYGLDRSRVAFGRALIHFIHHRGDAVLKGHALLARLAREQNRTLLMVTHSVESASHADRVLRLSHGQLIEER